MKRAKKRREASVLLTETFWAWWRCSRTKKGVGIGEERREDTAAFYADSELLMPMFEKDEYVGNEVQRSLN